MASNYDYSGHVDLEIINDKELLALFQELQTGIQSRIVINGLKRAGNVILQQAKSNWKSTKKNKSKTDYSAYQFRSEEIKKSNKNVGVKVGIPKSYNSFKIKFIEAGTKERSYTKNGKQHNTGSLKATHFWRNAVESKQEQAEGLISESITKSLNQAMKRYS